MASILRQIVAGPRLRHPEAGLDLCYVTDNIIATSGPSSTYPQRAYRIPTNALVRFLDYKHSQDWAIWEFRAEGTGYPDSEVYNRIRHYPWPDHHPPPFALIPLIMSSMRDWLKGPGAEEGRVVVVHCKAGKGRSGTVACSYLISEDKWTVEDALRRFTARRMRSGFGSGVSIPSQLRWVGYVDYWAKHGKVYVEREIEVLEVHVWGSRDGVRVAVDGFVDKGRAIKTFHTFTKQERTIMDGPSQGISNIYRTKDNADPASNPPLSNNHQSSTNPRASNTTTPPTSTVLYRPSIPLILPTSDINLSFERRNNTTYGLTMVTSVAHVWFNAYFESLNSSSDPSSSVGTTTTISSPPFDNDIDPIELPTSGVFSIPWEAMDGIKGSARKGTRALDRLSVVWRTSPSITTPSTHQPTATRTPSSPPKIISALPAGAPILETGPTDKDPNTLKSSSEPPTTSVSQTLGMRTESPANRNVRRASSLSDVSAKPPPDNETDSDDEAVVKAHGPDGVDFIPHVDHGANELPTAEENSWEKGLVQKEE